MLTVTPTSGLPTARFTVDSNYGPIPTTQCQTPTTHTFTFSFDKSQIWATKVSACNAKSAYDTGNNSITPPGPPAPGNHTVTVVMCCGATGAPLTTTQTYTVTVPPPTPTPPPPPPTSPPPPPPTHAASPIPTPIPTPSPRCTTEGPPHSCVPVDCSHL